MGEVRSQQGSEDSAA